MFEKEALDGATKICGYGECLYAFPCGHSNKNEDHILPFATDTGATMECPLARYQVTPELSNGFAPVTDIEFLALCLNCKLCRSVEDNGSIRHLRNDDICMNCPVYSLEKQME